MSINNTPLEERFGEKLEELREGKNMTREQLAEQVGLTARHIAALERGERRPTLNTMEKLLRTLGAPTEWLIYPEFEEQNARLREIFHLAATFSDEKYLLSYNKSKRLLLQRLSQFVRYTSDCSQYMQQVRTVSTHAVSSADRHLRPDIDTVFARSIATLSPYLL